jgi:hypothetical protein
MFDHSLWARMRLEYGAHERFPTVYAKTRPEVDVFRWLEEEQQTGEVQEGLKAGSKEKGL